MSLYHNIFELVGRTPILRLYRLPALHHVRAEIYVKLEYLNPFFSIKDRPALYMLEEAERQGLITPETTLIEPTSGNTGIALAGLCAAKGYPLIIVMPDSMSEERIKMIRHFGAELKLTPAAKGFQYSIDLALEMAANDKNMLCLNQMANPRNPISHEQTTAPEMWQDMNGKIDVFLGTVGSGGHFSGIARYLKKQNPDIRCIVMEPEGCPVLSKGRTGPHKLMGMGIGSGIIPKNLDQTLIDDVITVKDDDAFHMAREAARIEGLAVGISSGALLDAAMRLGQLPEMQGKKIVTLLPSAAERYISTELFAE